MTPEERKGQTLKALTTMDASGMVRVFFAKPNHTDTDAALAILNSDELQRADRFRFDVDRDRFISGRAVVRRSLSRLANIEPADWRFTANEFGRPEVADPIEGRSLRFSESGTKGLLMCAVTISFETVSFLQGAAVPRRTTYAGTKGLFGG
ncbi:MAG: hypothetical protein GY798_08810 [Hyphomicrobiales bacterium]|nr:hypothetical protein [Hyphomicrobiales bacterium]